MNLDGVSVSVEGPYVNLTFRPELVAKKLLPTLVAEPLKYFNSFFFLFCTP